MTTAVTISERAARRIGEILKTEGDGAMLRISVEGGGCSGFQYKFDVERAQAEDDLVIARDSAVVLVDPASVPFLAGSEVDFVDDLIGASFRVSIPTPPHPAAAAPVSRSDQDQRRSYSAATTCRRATSSTSSGCGSRRRFRRRSIRSR